MGNIPRGSSTAQNTSSALRNRQVATEFDVAVVGGGPVGLAAANLLAARGHSVILVEKNSSTSDLPKAISLDDEAVRILARAGLADAILGIVTPGTGTAYYDRKNRLLFKAGSPEPFALGYPFKNPFAQPEFEAMLRAALVARRCADVRFATSLDSLHTSDSEVNLTLSGPGRCAQRVRVGWVLACDGGRSTVRRLLDVPMVGTSFDVPWLVIDTVRDPHNEQHGMHHADPRRPHVIVAGRDGRCRYEFRLRPGEGVPGDQPSFDLIRRLLAPYRDIHQGDVERAVIYTFHALVAKRWQSRRCFLLGDAAHMMPPFAGQGLNSGLRDAGNLTWKLSDVLDGRLAPAALATYESERRPHAEATVRLSARLGATVMTTNSHKAAVRDILTRVALRTRPGRRYLTQMRYRPSAGIREGLVDDATTVPRSISARLGAPIAQPRVFVADHTETQLFDDVLGSGWSLLGVDLPRSAWEALAHHRLTGLLSPRQVAVALDGRTHHPGSVVTALDVDGRLQREYQPLVGRWLLVRPDRVVAAVGTATDVAALDRLQSAWSHHPRRASAPLHTRAGLTS